LTPIPLLARRLAAAVLPCLVAISCQVVPPPATFDGPSGRVRAGAQEEAQEVHELLERLHPRILETLPDTVERELEVWVQASPALYRFSEATSYDEADGFWSEGHGRIHLREAAGNLERTLAHELVHASLGESWSALPGTIEEGLCDVLATHLSPENAEEMRAGRLSAAAFALGGLELEVEVLLPGDDHPGGIRIGCLSRVRLLGLASSDLVPEEVFEVEAGLSSTDISTNEKKVFYGLSFVLVERIEARHGFAGLHELCLRARGEGHERVPREWLLEAAGLKNAGREEWRSAIHGAIGDPELCTLLLLYPSALLDTVARIFGPGTRVQVDLSGTSPLRARVAVPGSEAEVELGLLVSAIPEITAKNEVRPE